MSSTDSAAVEGMVEEIVRLVTERVLAGLKAAQELVSHSDSPLGSRRTLAAIRSGQLPALQVGRRYLVRRADLNALIAAAMKPAPSPDAADKLARELGLRRLR